ncbi:MAG: hypothetical protein AAB941_00745 [Patescibacteria group bacterium]
MLFSLGYVIIKSELGSEIATPREQFRSLKTEEKLTMRGWLSVMIDILKKMTSRRVTKEAIPFTTETGYDTLYDDWPNIA